MDNHFHTKLRLLPNYFKKIGLGIVLIWALIVVLIFLKIINLHLSEENLSEDNLLLLKRLIFTPLLIGLFLIGASKDKIEDELTLLIRLRSILWAFFFGTGYVILIPFMDFLAGSRTEHKPETIIMMMLIAYIMNYYRQKRNR